MSHITWATHIKRAEAKGKFSQRAKDKSESWPQCAVGEKFTNEGYCSAGVGDIILQGQHNDLRDLGLEFTRVVHSDNIKAAKRVYKKIQKVEL